MNTKGKTILVVEDEPKILDLMMHYLQNAGYEVWGVTDGEQARRMFEERDPCFVILDLMLPGESGESICQWIRREKKSDVPLIIVTAKVSERDRIHGLSIGADDYITKPFSPRELVARVETVLRRTENRCSKLSYRGITIKPKKREVKVKGNLIELTNHEFELLYLLMRHPNQILTQEQILARLYPNQEKVVIERTMDVHIGKLREKLGREHGLAIETVRGVGYRFAAY